MDGQHWLFFFIGLGFFIWAMRTADQQADRQHERRMEKMREFGIPREGRRFRRRDVPNK